MIDIGDAIFLLVFLAILVFMLWTLEPVAVFWIERWRRIRRWWMWRQLRPHPKDYWLPTIGNTWIRLQFDRELFERDLRAWKIRGKML